MDHSHHPAHCLQKPPDSSLVFEHHPSRLCCSLLACRLGPSLAAHVLFSGAKGNRTSVGLQSLPHCDPRASEPPATATCDLTGHGEMQGSLLSCPMPPGSPGPGKTGCFHLLSDAHIAHSLYPVMQAGSPECLLNVTATSSGSAFVPLSSPHWL